MMTAEAEKITRPGLLSDICIPKYKVPNFLIQIISFARRLGMLVVYRSERCYTEPHKVPGS